MSASPPALEPRHRPESKPLIVLLSLLQLGLMAAVWLLAIVPMALLALGVLAVKAVWAATGATAAAPIQPSPRRFSVERRGGPL